MSPNEWSKIAVKALDTGVQRLQLLGGCFLHISNFSMKGNIIFTNTSNEMVTHMHNS